MLEPDLGELKTETVRLGEGEMTARLRCWQVLSSGSGADAGLRYGNSGNGARCGSPSYADGL